MVAIFVFLVYLVYVSIPSPAQEYANATGDELNKSAQYLSELAEKGELTKQDVDEILSVLQPRLVDMAGRVRSKKSDLGIYYEELRLAWQLILQEAVSPSEAGILLQTLDPCRSVYKKKQAYRSAVIELHGRLIAPPQGVIMHHKIWLVVEKEQELLGLEGFLSTSSKGIASRNWGLERLTQYDVGEKPSLPLRKKTTVYLIPAEIAQGLPTRGHEADTLEIFKKTVADKDVRKLCSFQQATILKEENDWRNYFNIDRPPIK
jgi:hypothetical protein